MKKYLIVFMATILCILFTTLGVSASTDVDNYKYLPKVITTDNGYKMMFDSELARIARGMSVDSYDIAKDSNPQDIATTYKEEGFVDIQQSHSSDVIMDVFSNNFLVGVKTFEVDGEEKHVLAITFRGTDLTDKGIQGALTDIFTDITVIDENGFHRGFYAAAAKAYLTLGEMEFPSLKNEDGSNMTFYDYLQHSRNGKSGYSILVTGHSLGGAVANVFAVEWLPPVAKNNVMCYTFASPLVCSPEKAKEYDAYNIFNIVNTKDVVSDIGYHVFGGVRLGIDLVVTVTDSTEDAHDLRVTYEKATNLVVDKIDSLYPYIYRKCYTVRENDAETEKDEIVICKGCSIDENMFSGALGKSDLLIKAKLNIGTDVITTGDMKLIVM